MRVAGLILAGGTGRRMGGRDKALLRLADRPLLAHVIDRFAPQVEMLALSANGDVLRFAGFGLPVLQDGPSGAGPLAGLLAGLDWANAEGATALVTVAVDTPFLPCDLVPRLILAGEETGSAAALAESGGQTHPTFGLWPIGARGDVAQALAAGRLRLREVAEEIAAGRARFDTVGLDPFANINRPEDMAEAEARLAGEAS
jgi:molybdopterin-guanine dinucleotide biosynthesis protein A